jgi:hypothetical protein
MHQGASTVRIGVLSALATLLVIGAGVAGFATGSAHQTTAAQAAAARATTYASAYHSAKAAAYQAAWKTSYKRGTIRGSTRGRQGDLSRNGRWTGASSETPGGSGSSRGSCGSDTPGGSGRSRGSCGSPHGCSHERLGTGHHPFCLLDAIRRRTLRRAWRRLPVL